MTPETRLLFIGDSMAQGLAPHVENLAHDEGIAAFAARGIVGTRLDQWAKDPWLDAELQSFSPTLVLVSLGTNDEAMGAGAADRQSSAFEALLAKISASGAEVAWVGPPSLPFPRHGVSDMIRARVPHYFASESLDIPRAPDGLHPNVSGYAGWAGAIWQWLG